MSETFDLETVPSPQITVAEGYDLCKVCGKTLKVTATGTLRKHKCEPADDQVTAVPDVKRPPVRRRTKTQAPEKVRTLGVAVLAAGIEWSADQTLSRATGLPTSQIPSELPDADAMIGPFVNLLWPQIPKGAQKALTELADHEDLIAASFAWFAWAQTLKEFTETVNAEKARREDVDHGSIEVSGPTPGGSIYPTDYVPFAVAGPSV